MNLSTLFQSFNFERARKLLFCFLMIYLIALTGTSVYATTYYSNSSTSDPNNVNNWWQNNDDTGLPHPVDFTAAGDVFIIQLGHTYSTTGAWNVAGEVQVNGTYNNDNNSVINILTVSGGTVNNNIATLDITTLNLGGSLNINFNNKDVTVSTALTMSGISTVTGANVNRLLTLNGTFNVAAGATATITGTSFTVLGATTINGSFAFDASNTGKKIFKNNITISATGTWDNAVGEDPNINGNITNNGSWIGCTGGSCLHTIGKEIAGTYTFSGNPIAMSVMNINTAGTTVINTGTLMLSSGSGATSLYGPGTFTNQGTLYLAGGSTGVNAPVTISTFNCSFAGNTVYYNAGNDQAVTSPNDGSYYNLKMSTSNIKTFQTGGGTISVSNLLTIEDAAIFNVGTNTLSGAGGLTMTGTSNLQIAKCSAPSQPELTGTYSLTGGTITLNGNCVQTFNTVPTGASTCYGLNLGGTSAKTITGLTTINGDITISGSATISGNSAFTMSCSKTLNYNSSGATTLTAAQDISIGSYSQTDGTLIDNGVNITVCGSSWTLAAGTFTATGRAIFNGSTTVSGAATTTFGNVTVNATKTLIAHATNMIVNGADFTNDGTFTHNSGTITFSGTTTILGASITTFNNLTISAGTLTGHSTNVNIEGNWTNNSAFTHNSGTITFTGGSAQSLAGTATTTFFNMVVNKTASTILTQTATTTSVNNLLTMTEGIFNTGTNTLNGAGGLTATGGDLQLAKITTTPELTGTYTITGGTVTLNGAGAQTLRTSTVGGSTYYNLVFGTSGAKTITGLLTINGDVTVSGSATTATNSAFTQAASKTYNYNSSGSSTMFAATNFTIGSYVQTAGTFTLNSNIMTVTGSTWNKSGGTIATAGRVIFQGSVTQTFTHNANNFVNVTINNSSGLQLNNDISITTNLTFTSGNIITGSLKVILTFNAATVTGAAQGVGFVDGNLQKYISASPKTFEIGSSGNYAPLNFTFASITTAGNLSCSTTAGDHADIQASDIDPNKSVNRFWNINYSTLVITTFGATFNYPSSEVDGAADPSAFGVQQYNGVSWALMTISGTPTSTSAIITGAAATTSRDYIVGERFNPNGLYNAVTGAMNWNNINNWIRYRSGTITTTIGNPVVTGVGTLFTTQFVPGDVLLSQTTPGTALGTVLSVDSDLQITLTAGASSSVTNESCGIQAIPAINDEVNIGNPYIAGAAVDVTLDVDATVFKLVFTRMAYSNTLTHSGAFALTMTNNVLLKQPSTANTNAWNINAGTATVAGNLTIGSIDATAGLIARANLTTGTINVTTNLVFNGTAAANGVLDLSGGAGTLNLSGNFTLTNTASAWGTFTPGATSIVNYNRTTSSQTVNLTTIAPAVTYANLHLNNTSAAGATMTLGITTTRVTGNFRVQSGKFTYGGTLLIVGNAGKVFEVVNGATFEMTASANPPTGFGTFTFGATSITQYHQNIARTITVRTYGHLQIQPTANVTHTFQAGTTNVQGNLDLGNGTTLQTCTVAGVATAAVVVTGNITLNTGVTYTLATPTTNPAVTIAGNWVNNGGTFTPSTKTVTFNGTADQQINGTPATQTFYNVIVTKTAGTILSVGGSTVTLTTNNITVNTGTLDAPPTLNMNSTTNAILTLAGGIFNGNASSISITGDWVNNGGTFNPGTSTVNFTDATARQINGTAAAQTFNNIIVNKTNVTLSTGGSTVTLTANDFTLTNGNFTAPATMNITGNLLVDADAAGDTYTSGTNLNASGNITHNTGSITWGTNVSLIGTATQIISGTSTISNFNNFIINNSFPVSAITLSAPITVDAAFTLTDGHLITDATNILTLGTAAAVSLNAPVTQDSSFVRGPMVHLKSSAGSETKVFPVGKDSSMHRMNLIVNHSDAGATTYTGEYIGSSAKDLGWALPITIDTVSRVGYWTLSKGGIGTVSAGAVKLYYNYDGVTDPANLVVAKGNPAAWEDMGGPGNGAPIGDITSSVNFTTFGYFTLGNKVGGSNPLPIILLSFDANPDGNNVNTKWITATETNNAFFTIEKSKDGSEFEFVANVTGAGNSTSVLNYSLIDDNPYKGVSYYRLKQTDFDGNFSYSNIVAVEFNNLADFNFDVYPNPSTAEENINLLLKGNVGEEVLVVVYDITGKKDYSKVLIIQTEGDNVYAVDYSKKLSPGIYIITATSNQAIYSKKLIVK